MEDLIPFPPRLPPGPSGTRMTACEVLTWIALGKAQKIQQMHATNLNVLWDTQSLLSVCEGLEGRLGIGSPEVWGPFCNTAVYDVNGMQAARHATKSGPALLRLVRARSRRERGCLVSYADLLGELLSKIERGPREDRLISQATWELLEALRPDQTDESKIVATGRPRYPNGERNTQAPMQDISNTVFADPAYTIDLWGEAMADLYAPGVAVPYHHGTTFSDVSFATNTKTL